VNATRERFYEAFHTHDVARFLELVFPPEWKPVAARILESGVTIAEEMCPWAPRWSPVPPTVRLGRPGSPEQGLATLVKSCIYRAHDCLHQLWGLPLPGQEYTEEDFFVYKRSQMCGEVAVLTLTEFVLCDRLRQLHPELSNILQTRNALAMLDGPLRGRSLEQIAARLDTLLHKQMRPKWVREHAPSMAFCDDYIPMLEHDRRAVDHNWALMKATKWDPKGLPDARYSQKTDGLELTLWMIRDFQQILDTGESVDSSLREFNLTRRAGLVLPQGWNEL